MGAGGHIVLLGMYSSPDWESAWRLMTEIPENVRSSRTSDIIDVIYSWSPKKCNSFICCQLKLHTEPVEQIIQHIHRCHF